MSEHTAMHVWMNFEQDVLQSDPLLCLQGANFCEHTSHNLRRGTEIEIYTLYY